MQAPQGHYVPQGPPPTESYYQGPPPEYHQGPVDYHGFSGFPRNSGYKQADQTVGNSHNFFKDNQKFIMVSAILFIVMFYTIPRVKNFFPQLFNTEGNINIIGAATLSLLAGLVYQLSDKYMSL